MLTPSEAHPQGLPGPREAGAAAFYRPLACWFCLPSFVFLLAPLLKTAGETGAGLSLLAVLTSVWIAPLFTLGALALAMFGHETTIQRAGDRRMWGLITLAIAANLLLSAGGLATRLLH
jgi:hypothetical protein